jgi:fibro-slime domain-containing protein
MKRASRRDPSGPGHKLLLCLSLAGFALAPAIARADSVTVTVNYYKISPGDPDTQQGISGVVTNEVQNHLGPNGLPVLNTATYGCASDCYGSQPIHDVNPATGELTYWTPGSLPSGNPNVTPDGTTTTVLPFDDGTLFPPGGAGSSNANGFQSAVLSSIINVPTTESIGFSVGADDDAFVYLNGVLACDLGGVHANSPGTCTSATVGPGNYSLQVFYADLHTTQASLDFAITTPGINSVTPEPPSILLLGSALLGVGALALRRRTLGFN